MSHHRIAVVSILKGIRPARLSRVVAAIQKQVTRDFAPLWHINAEVKYFKDAAAAPSDWWLITIGPRRSKSSGDGSHDVKRGKPFGVVNYSRSWPLTLSHEVLEILGDPSCKATIPGPWPIPPKTRRVNYPLEMCDPVEDGRYSYRIDGVQVSDFITPAYFKPAARKAQRYSFRNNLKQPLSVGRKGFQDFHDPHAGRDYRLILWASKHPMIAPSPKLRKSPRH